MVLEPLSMTIMIGWCFRLTLQLLLTPFRVKPFLKNFKQCMRGGGQLSQFFPFVHFFYDLQVPLYFSHHSSSGALLVILSFMCSWQGTPSNMAFSCLVHFCALCCSLGFSLCVSSLFKLMIPISLALPMLSFLPLIILLSCQLLWGCLSNSCLAWVLSGSPLRFILFVEFCCPFGGMGILGVPFGFASFIFFIFIRGFKQRCLACRCVLKVRGCPCGFKYFFLMFCL